MRTRVSLAILPLTLVSAALVATTGTPTATAAEPVPSPVWGARLSQAYNTQPLSGRIDSFGGRTFVVGTTSDGSGPGYEYNVRDASGAEVLQDLGGLDDKATLNAVDAGAWGAVVAGGVDGDIGDAGAGNAGGSDAWVRLYAPDGTVEWTTQVGGASSEQFTGVLVTGDTVVAVGSGYYAGADSLYTFDLTTGAATGPIAIDVPPQSASITSVSAAPGGDVVILGVTDREIDASDEGSSHEWLARLDGDDLSQVVWETNGPESDATQAFAYDAEVIGSSVYVVDQVASAGSPPSGFLTSYDVADGSVRWHRATGSSLSIGVGVTAYRGQVVVGGVRIATVVGASYKTLLQGWTAAGKRLWTTDLEGPDDASSSGFTYIAGLAAGTQGLVAAGISNTLFGPDTSTSYNFVAGLRIRAPRTTVKTTGAFAGTATTKVKRGASKTAQVRLTNIGELTDKLSLKGCVVPASVTMKVTSGKKDVTKAVRNGSFTTPALAVKKSLTLGVKIVAGPKANLRTISCKLVSSSVANPDNTSTGLLKITVTK